MAQFYFHVATTDDFIADFDGLEFENLSACHNHALRIIRECLPFVQSDQRRWWIEVADAKGAAVLTVLYPRRSAVRSRCRQRDWWKVAFLSVNATEQNARL